MAKTVILDHDGNKDDFVAMILLLSNPKKVNLIGCICTDADCFVENGFDVTGKIMCAMHRLTKTPLFPIGKSTATAVNAFPTEWRFSAKNLDDMPFLNIVEDVALWEKLKPENEAHNGQQLLADLVMKSKEKVTVCVTGPLSNMAWCIEKYGEAFTSKVEECVIMGGAVDVGGNVFLPTTDGSAEWNIYWDPPAAKKVLCCPNIRCVLFSLDATNTVPVRSVDVKGFGAQNQYLLSQMVGTMWAMSTHEEILRDGDAYYAWDALTAAYILEPTIATLEPVALDVDVSKGKSEGRTPRASGEGKPCAHVARNPSKQMFHDLVFASTRVY
uniref:Inosine-adenosine-guanosine-nucleoside hydrolase n=1 Tax=Trypanosoma brucei brucei TaxID=5702 RepID=O15727_TRYBB|nr:inosine-adenosine-guanosine-nucleoside hydrolase [Trypanosoma brucei brucei]